jgi:hypothetical protein
MRLEFCHWLCTNHQLLLLVSVLFADEATFTTQVTHIHGLTTVHMVLWKQIFNIVSLSVCGAV